MELRITNNLYVGSNRSLYISDDLKTISAKSYRWWEFVTRDNAGNVIFIDTSYSVSTSKHQSEVKDQLGRLGIQVNLTLYNTFKPFNRGNGIKTCIDDEISLLRDDIKTLIGQIKTKGSWKRKNAERRDDIRLILHRIKDLRNYRDNYIDKKPIPLKRKSLKSMVVGHWGAKLGFVKSSVIRVNSFKRWFKKPNGKVDYNGLTDLLNKVAHYGDAPTNIDALKALLDLKPRHREPLLLYRFSQDINNMIPNKDSKEYQQLKAWLKRNNISQDNLTTLSLDKIHTYLINKLNRKNYEPRPAEPLPVHPVLQNLRGMKDLILIETDKDLRREGREQSHCIGSSTYMNLVKAGYQAFRYKGHTFFLDPELNLIEAHGKHNRHTPSEVRSEIMGLIRESQESQATLSA